MNMAIFLDAGHGGYDNGASYQGRKEKDDTLDLTLAVGEMLSQNGVNVGYTRVNDVYDSPIRKAQIANEEDAELFISIHRNESSVPNTKSGVKTLIFNNSGIKAEIANEINQQLAEVGYEDLGIAVRPDLAVLRKTRMPALLVEVGFINNDEDNFLFDSRFEDIAYAIANGIYSVVYETELKRDARDDLLYPPTLTEDNTGEQIMAAEQISMMDMMGDQTNLNIPLTPDTSTEYLTPEYNLSEYLPPEQPVQWEMSANQGDYQQGYVPIDNYATGNYESDNYATENYESDNYTFDNYATNNYITGNYATDDYTTDVYATENDRVGYITTNPRRSPINIPSHKEKRYQVQVGLFRYYEYALNLANQIRMLGFFVQVVPYEQYQAVRVGNNMTYNQGISIEHQLRRLGYDTLLVEI